MIPNLRLAASLRTCVACLAIMVISGCGASTTPTRTAPVVGSPTAYSSAIQIEAPSYVENPDIVPFAVELREPLRKGDSLSLYIDGNVAYRIEVSNGLQVDMFSGRVRSMAGHLEAKADRHNGPVQTASFSVRQTKRSSIPELEDRGTQYRQAISRGEIRAIFNNYMGSRGFIEEIHIETDNGSVVVATSPYVSTNPFIWIQGNFQTASIRAVALHVPGQEIQPPTAAPRPSDVKSVSTGTA